MNGDDMVIVQCLSIYHFAEMLASEDYQDIDRKTSDGEFYRTLWFCVRQRWLSLSLI